MSRGQALPVPQRQSQGGFLTTLNLHNLDIHPIPTKNEQLDNYIGWVYGCVKKISEDLRANPRGLFIKKGDRREDWVPMPPKRVHPMFKRPNLEQTWGQFIELRNQHKDLTGESWWHMLTNTPGGKPFGMELIQPDFVEDPNYNRERTFIESWNVTIPGNATKPIDSRDLILDFYQNPHDRTRGASPVESFALAHHMDLYLRAYGVKLIRDGAMIGQYVTSESVKSPDQADLAEARIMKRYRTPGRVPVFGPGTELHSTTIPLKDLAFITLLKPSMDMVLGIYNVPRSKFGLTEGAGDTNQTVADKAYQENCQLPRLRTFDEIINDVVMPRIYGDEAEQLAYESENPVEADREFELKKASQLFTEGASTLNQYRESVGEEPVGPSGDVYFIPTTVRVVKSLDEAVKADAAVAEPPVAGEEPVAPGEEPAPKVPPETGPAKKPKTQKDLDAATIRLARAISRSAKPSVNAIAQIRKLRKQNALLEFERVQGRHERIMKGKLRTLFAREGKAVRAALMNNLREAAVEEARAQLEKIASRVASPEAEEAARSGVMNPLLRNWLDDALSNFVEDWRSLFLATTLTGAEAGWVLLQQEIVGALAFKQYEQKAAEFARHHAGERVTDIHMTTEGALRETIAKGIETGSAISEISNAVGEIYDGWKGHRAEAIALTETSTSISWGRFQAAVATRRRLGSDIRRSWISVHDGRTRPTHEAADGDPSNHDITLDQFYNVGGHHLAHPGDPNAPPEEIVRCRCTETYRDADFE